MNARFCANFFGPWAVAKVVANPRTSRVPFATGYSEDSRGSGTDRRPDLRVPPTDPGLIVSLMFLHMREIAVSKS